MNRKLIALFSVFVVLGGAVLVLFLTDRAAWSGLHWEIEEGDEFTFEISVTLQQIQSLYPIPNFTLLDGLRIIASVVTLPNLSQSYTPESFLTEVIRFQKTTCTFENGSQIPSEFESYLERLTSYALFPVGAWIAIDNLYPDNGQYYLFEYNYASITDDILTIGTHRYNFDKTDDWSADVSTVDGVAITTRNYDAHGVDYAYEVILDLVP